MPAKWVCAFLMLVGRLELLTVYVIATTGGNVTLGSGLLTVGGLVLAYPSAAATTCPGCYGLTRVTDDVY